MNKNSGYEGPACQQLPIETSQSERGGEGLGWNRQFPIEAFLHEHQRARYDISREAAKELPHPCGCGATGLLWTKHISICLFCGYQEGWVVDVNETDACMVWLHRWRETRRVSDDMK